jgi:energy-coupling factor transport system ATP-binding protein
MEEFIDRSPEELSGGQKQRVAIAGALAMETELMIFDESTSMLDPKGTKEVNQMIKQIKNDQNKTIIVITHNLEEASYADRVIVLNAGEIVADGTPMEVFKQEEVLEESGLKTMDSVSLIHNLKNKQFKNKKEIEEALWELTFNE